MKYSIGMTLLFAALVAGGVGCSGGAAPGEEQTAEGTEAMRIENAPTTPTEGWTHTPNFPGQTCIFKKVCKWIHAEPPFRTCSGSVVGTDCEIFCDKECLYPVQPLPMPIPDPVINQ